MSQTVTLYSRQGCHLCEEAKLALESVRQELPFQLEELDITKQDALHAAYLERIPVVALDGVEIFEFFVDEQALRDALRASGPA